MNFYISLITFAIWKNSTTMKKVIVVLSTMFLLVAVSYAQPRAIGGRFGMNLEVSYQHSFGERNFLQVDAGMLYWYRGVKAEGTYNWIFATPDWTTKGSWEWYAGLGAGVGFDWHTYTCDKKPNVPLHTHAGYLHVGLVGMVGLSYTFWFPLQLSIDYRPLIGVRLGTYHRYNLDADYFTAFYVPGMYDFAFSVRYKF